MFGRNLTIASVSKWAGIAAITSFVVLLATALFGLSELRVGGPVYNRIVDAKDLIADILPPPAYIVESYLEVTLALKEPSRAGEHAKKLGNLKRDFDARQQFWKERNIDPSVKKGLTETSADPANVFWRLTETEFLPALQRGDMETAHELYERISEAYALHRAAIEKVVTGANDMAAASEAFSAERNVLVMTVVGLAALLVAAMMLGSTLGVSFGIVRPLLALTNTIKAVADDDLDVDIPSKSSRSELGDMARALVILKDGAVERRRLEADARARLEDEKKRQDALKAGVQTFLDTSGTVLRSLQQQTRSMRSSADILTSAAVTASSEASQATEAAAEASGNSQAVAAATEQLGASIKEIAGQAHATSAVVAEATASAEKTDQEVAGFVEVAERIGSIVETIRSIARQTNLLALNATIEAARAGDAGKGFAVVAQEVKALAAQTAKATEEVGQQIAAMQESTRSTVQAVRSIATRIADINGMTGAIAAAVEQQDQATQEIARRVSMAASGTGIAAAKAESVNGVVTKTRDEAQTITGAAREVAEAADKMSSAVNAFVGVVGCDLEDRRRAERRETALQADIRTSSGSVSGVVADISKTGAKLRKAEPLQPGTSIKVKLGGQEVGAKTVWDKYDEAGVRFDTPLEDVTPFVTGKTSNAA